MAMTTANDMRKGVFETLDEAHARHWWVRVMAEAFLRVMPAYIKGENLVYLSAALRLVLNDLDGFQRHGSTLDHIRFYGHKRKGKKLVAVKAAWA